MTSVQEKFTIVLQERLNKLEELFENNLMTIHPDTESYKNLICSDIGCVGAAAYIKIITTNEDSVNQMIETIKNFKGLKAFTYHFGKLSNYSQYIPEDAYMEYEIDFEEEKENPDAFIIQILVCFKHSIVASRVGVDLCKNLASSDKIELQPIYDFRGDINQNTGLFRYYYYNIVALQNNKHPDIICERDVCWYKSDGTHVIHEFIGSANYADMFRKVDLMCILPHKYKNY